MHISRLRKTDSKLRKGSRDEHNQMCRQIFMKKETEKYIALWYDIWY
jgi:hypothetical protein